ncbi:hypothetical protein DOY81_008290 [Sarcophaga bullata]|nr:hypothetical protein DOY81_008290 [Sarcophaga bullata]
MSRLQIGRDIVEKLTHESIEIRLRALEQVTSKLNRAMAVNETIEFKVGEVCKQLIRWFGFSQVQQSLQVLKLLDSIIESPIYGPEAVKKLGIERLIKEFKKLQVMFDGEKEEMKVIDKIKKVLKIYNNPTQYDDGKSRKIPRNTNELIESTSNTNYGVVLNLDEYEVSWSRPSASDYTTMKFISDILTNPLASFEEIDNAVQHLELTMGDYPAEYMLQAPHLFRNLLELYDEHKNGENKEIPVDSVARALLEFLFNLDKRIRRLRKTVMFRQRRCDKDKNQLSSTNNYALCQLKYEKALVNILKVSITHLEKSSSHDAVLHIVWNIIFMTIKIMEIMGRRSIDITCFQEVAPMVIKLNLKLTDTEHCARMRLNQMKMIFLLQDFLSIYSTRGVELKTTEILKPILSDYCMKCLFNKRHKILETILVQSDITLNKQCQMLKSFEESFDFGIKLLKNEQQWSCNDIIAQGNNIIKILDILQSQRLVDILFEAIIKACPIYISNVTLRENALNLLLNLLKLTFLPLKRYSYNKIFLVFKCHIGCLMSGERYVMECANSELFSAQIIGVPLSIELLLQFVYDAFESLCNEIQNNCLQIFELLLQSQNLFGANWYSLLQLMTPVLPLLTCTASKKLTDLLLKLYDPDLKLLPFMCVLKGNLILLFHTKMEIRSEALSRLIYSISSLTDADKYVPSLIEIGDTLPNDICVQSSHREYTNIFRDHSPLERDVIISLNNLLQLMESPDVEPFIRKTTLMQINVLCTNWRLTGELCKLGAHYLILQALENSLRKSSGSDYPDSAVPAISILNKVMLYDSSVRFELSETPNIYVLILRALIMYNHDIQTRQDASMCLFQLLFASHLISTDKMVEGPTMLGNLNIPFTLNMCPALIDKVQQESEKLSTLFSNKIEEKQYWRMVIAATFCGGLINITHKSIPLISQLDFCDDLKLTSQDVRLIRASQPSVSLYRLTKAALNSTDHKSLMQACIMLKHQLLIAKLNNTFHVGENICIDLNIILQKYLQLSPGNKLDFQLYEHLLDVLIICLEIPLSLVILEFFKVLQKDMRHAFITLITQREEISLRIYCKIAEAMRLIINACKDNKETESRSFYSNLYDLIIERCVHLFQIRDLQRVRCLLSLITCISLCNMDMPDQLLFFYCRRFAQLSLALKSFTQTGAQWHRNCLLAILRLSDQMHDPYLNFRLSAGILKYCSGLCGHNDDEIRVLAWSILNITVKTKNIEASQRESKSTGISGSELLLNELSYLPGGFIACCFSTLLDFEEIIGVRYLAGQLLAILIRKQQNLEEIEKLFERHQFLPIVTDAITSALCTLEEEIPTELETSDVLVTDCDLFSCYALICTEFSLRQPSFLKELCSQAFMFKLYEIVKHSPPNDKHVGYLNTLGHICRLYTLCYVDNFIFLQRTICRDIVWITTFCEILFKIVLSSGEDNIITDMLQLFIVLCKDEIALDQLSSKLINYCVDIVKFFQYSLTLKNLNTRLQSCSLSILNILLMNTQLRVNTDLSTKILETFETPKILIKSIRKNTNFEADNKQNCENTKAEKDRSEGRTALSKVHVLDVFNSIHPFNPKAHQFKTEILILWLKFWELYSRYEEGAQSHHLNILCSIINKSNPGSTKRLISLRILRNMAFLNNNRSGLITSKEFLYTINEIITHPVETCLEEQFIVSVSIWKLISGGIKFVALMRSTKLVKHLRMLKDSLLSKQLENADNVEQANNLLNVLNIIFQIFKTNLGYTTL